MELSLSLNKASKNPNWTKVFIFSDETLEKALSIVSSLFVYCPLRIPGQLIMGTLICMACLGLTRQTKPLVHYLNASYILAEWVLIALRLSEVSLGYGSVFVTIGMASAVFIYHQRTLNGFSFERIPTIGFIYALISAITLIIYGLGMPTSHLQDLVTPFEHLPLWTIPLCGIGLASINALWEEVLFRGFYVDSFKRYPLLLWIVPSLLFGFMHYQNGFPKGLVGIILTAIFGLMMTHVRLTTKSLVPGIIIHTICDSVIFMVLVVSKIA